MIATPVQHVLQGHAALEITERGTRPHRLPAAVRTRFPDPQLMMAEGQPSGVRLVFTTEARRIELDLHTTRVAYRSTARPRGRVDLVVDRTIADSVELGAGDLIEIDLTTGGTAHLPGPGETVRFQDLPVGAKRVEIWLPHNESVELGELRTDAAVEPVPARTRWVHHGSSISQGSNAVSPARTWPATVARAADVDLVNLGFGGSAMVDPFVARVIRDRPADLISLKFGINVVNLDAMRRRILVPALHGFLDTVRDGHPETPLVLISALHCGIHEDTPGPGAIDPASIGTDQIRFVARGRSGDTELGRLTLGVVREALAEVAAVRDDPHLHLLDGLSLYGPDDAAEHPLLDGLHPDTETHHLVAERFSAWALGDDRPFGPKR